MQVWKYKNRLFDVILNKFMYRDLFNIIFTSHKVIKELQNCLQFSRKKRLELSSLKIKKTSAVQNFAIFLNYKRIMKWFELDFQWPLCYLNSGSTEEFPKYIAFIKFACF